MTSSSSCLAVHLVMQTVAEAGLNTLGSAGWSPASELCKKLHSFSFARCLWVTDTNTGGCQRNTSQPPRVSSSSARGCRFNSLLTNFGFWSHERRNENSSEKKPWTAYLFFIWWSKNQWDEQNSISLSCLFSCLDFPFFLLKKNKNKIYIHIFNKLQKPTFLVCFFSLGNYFMQWCMICHIDVDQCHSPWSID